MRCEKKVHQKNEVKEFQPIQKKIQDGDKENQKSWREQGKEMVGHEENCRFQNEKGGKISAVFEVTKGSENQKKIGQQETGDEPPMFLPMAVNQDFDSNRAASR